MRQTYVGLDPAVAAARLDAMQEEVEAMRAKVRPLSEPWMALDAIRAAVIAASPALTGRPNDPARLLGARTPTP
ncbi:MAG: hypothetical protein GC145_06300 [Caulobacter sp.]|nr:hypothetical protein [Caulobacter sp.]